MKSKEELNAIKQEVETVSRKLCALTDEELVQVVGGIAKRKPYGFSSFQAPCDTDNSDSSQQ